MYRFVVFAFLILWIRRASAFEREYILSYDGFYNEAERSAIRGQIPFGRIWITEKRPYIHTDFDIIRADLWTLNLLRRNGRIIDVQPLPSTIHHRKLLFPHRISPTAGNRKSNLDIRNLADSLNVKKLWVRNFTGNGIRIAVLDTGLSRRRQHFRNIVMEKDFTDDGSPNDSQGHGTFVAGVLAGSGRECPGIAPDAQLFIYKVFNKNRESRTSWFLDAFNDALRHDVDIINLSIGGPDFLDLAFVRKVRELTEMGISFVSATGNDGPQMGTVSNPADELDVVGVGAINRMGQLAKFSSRGMTTREFPYGYGRMKPDLVTFGVRVQNVGLSGGCRYLSGTSVAVPIVSAAVALLMSSHPTERRNLGRIKQSLMEGAEPILDSSIFESGSGRLSLLNSFAYFSNYEPKIALYPPYLDTTECPRMWPFCSQPLFFGSKELTVNLTVISGFGETMRLRQTKILSDGRDILTVGISGNDSFGRWSGALGIHIGVKSESFAGTVEIRIRLDFEIESKKEPKNFSVDFPMKIWIFERPERQKRILWDQFRQLYYPIGIIPRDDLRDPTAPLESTIDSLQTNFRIFFDSLRNHGFFVDTSGYPLTCTNLNDYGYLMIVDPEEEFFPEEIIQIREAVRSGLSLIVAANWFSTKLLDRMNFETNSGSKRPDTGGSNIPALNELLSEFGFEFGESALEGNVSVFEQRIWISSGNFLSSFPSTAFLLSAKLKDITTEIVEKRHRIEEKVFCGIDWPFNGTGGSVTVFGDSKCLESGDCISTFLKFLTPLDFPFDTKTSKKETPKRYLNGEFAKISKVVRKIFSNGAIYHRSPECFSSSSLWLIPKEEISDEYKFQRVEELSRLKQMAEEYFAENITFDLSLLSEQNDEVEETNGILRFFFVVLLIFVLLALGRFGSQRLRVFAPIVRRII